MGLSKSKITINFEEICENYKYLVRYITINKIFAKDEILFQLVNKYIENYDDIMTGNSKLLKDIDILCVHSVHKLYPKIYYSKEPITKEWLISACTSHNDFCTKITTLLMGYDFKRWRKAYLIYLGMCKKNKPKHITPTMVQKFMWSAHMQDNISYINDSIDYFGEVLEFQDK